MFSADSERKLRVHPRARALAGGSWITTTDHVARRLDVPAGTVWSALDPIGVPCFTTDLVRGVLRHQRSIAEQGFSAAGTLFWVFGSRTPGIFSLGGDLRLMGKVIETRNRDALLEYGRLCIDNLALRLDVGKRCVTIALIQGDAMSGGLEWALSSDVIIAERSAKLGFPEVKFNLFPGLGALSFLSRRVHTRRAQQLLLDGALFTAESLYEIGLVDVLAEDGEGEAAVRRYIDKSRDTVDARLAVQRATNLIHPITYDALWAVCETWVDAALALGDRQLEMMRRIIAAQDKRFGAPGSNV